MQEHSKKGTRGMAMVAAWGEVLKPQSGRRSFCSGSWAWESGASHGILVALLPGLETTELDQGLSNLSVYIRHQRTLQNSDSNSVVLEWHQRLCTSNNLPGDANAAGPQTELRVMNQMIYESIFHLEINDNRILHPVLKESVAVEFINVDVLFMSSL